MLITGSGAFPVLDRTGHKGERARRKPEQCMERWAARTTLYSGPRVSKIPKRSHAWIPAVCLGSISARLKIYET